MEKDKKPPIRAEIEECSVRRTDAGVEVGVTVRNTGDRPVFATTGVRQIQLDESSGRLDVWFSDHGRDIAAKGGRCRIDSAPRTQVVEPGTSKRFTARLHPTYTRIVAHADESFHFEEVDLQHARTLVAHIAVADAPFYYTPKAGPIIRQLVRWGEPRTANTPMPRDGRRPPRGKHKKEAG
jgi:hypothetical protein